MAFTIKEYVGYDIEKGENKMAFKAIKKDDKTAKTTKKDDKSVKKNDKTSKKATTSKKKC